MIRLKVMIVEDESLERMLLRRFLEAENDVYELVKEASFALEALEYLDEHSVDIVITDINMPVMDGLEMAQRILQMDPTVQVIVTTGFNDFEHAQRSLKIGIADYLVKPVDAKEFACILASVREKILNRQGGGIESTEIARQIAERMPTLRDCFLHEMVTTHMDPTVCREKLSFFKLEMAGEYFQIGVVSLLQNDLDAMQQLFALFSIGNMARETLEYVHVFLENDNLLVLLNSHFLENPTDFEALKRMLDATLDIPFAIGVGTVVEGIGNVSRSYTEAVLAHHCHSVLGTHQVIYYQDLGIVEDKPTWVEPLQEAMGELDQMGLFLRGGMNANVGAWVERHFSDETENIENERIRAMLVIARLYAMHVFPQMNLRDYITQMFDLQSLGEIRALLCVLMGEASSTLESMRTSAVSRQIQDIIDYVREHLSDPSLSLHETSKHFFFNASYLSRIFKQNTGMSFREYVNNQRIELACRYLGDPNAKAYEVGVRVGIEDPNYFSTLFKKFAGMTIRQYRAGLEHG
jgi:two-component system, response regulator YesN